MSAKVRYFAETLSNLLHWGTLSRPESKRHETASTEYHSLRYSYTTLYLLSRLQLHSDHSAPLRTSGRRAHSSTELDAESASLRHDRSHTPPPLFHTSWSSSLASTSPSGSSFATPSPPSTASHAPRPFSPRAHLPLSPPPPPPPPLPQPRPRRPAQHRLPPHLLHHSRNHNTNHLPPATACSRASSRRTISTRRPASATCPARP